MFARYVDLERFPTSAFFNIGFIYLYSFMSIGMLAVDLSFTLYNRDRNDLQQQQADESILYILWNIIYWGSLVHGSILPQFYGKYWTSGHFTVGRRMKHACSVSHHTLTSLVTNQADYCRDHSLGYCRIHCLLLDRTEES